MKRLFLFLVVFLLVGGSHIDIAFAGSATLSWDAPTTNADGSQPAVVTGYRVYSSTLSGQYVSGVDVGNVVNTVMEGLSAGTWYFVVTAYNASGESSYSNEVSKVIPQAKPNAPTGCKVQ